MKRTTTHPGVLFFNDVALWIDLPLKTIQKKLRLSPDNLLKFFSGNYPCDKVLAKRIGRMTNTSWESWYEMQQNHDASKGESNV